jgi:hypothetical protein
MYRHHMHNDYHANPCAVFTLGVMVGFVASAKIRFMHKLHKELHNKYGHNCCSDHYHTDIKEDTESAQAKGNVTE